MSTTIRSKLSTLSITAAAFGLALASATLASPANATTQADQGHHVNAKHHARSDVRDSYAAVPASQNNDNNCGTGLMNIAIPCE